MLSTIMALLGALGGGALRIVPELIEAWRHRNDPSNELELARLALEQTKAELANKLELAQTRAQFTDAQAAAVSQIAQSTAQVIGHQAQAHLSGIKWVDGTNLLVRPVVTLWLLGLYSLYKALTVYVAIKQGTALDDVANIMWTPDDVAIFSGAITFWFVDQSISNRPFTAPVPKLPKVNP